MAISTTLGTNDNNGPISFQTFDVDLADVGLGDGYFVLLPLHEANR